MYSLRLWLAILMVAGVGLSVVVAGWFSTRDAYQQIEELFDAQMLQTTKLLEGIYGSNPLPLSLRGVVLPVDETEVETFLEQRDTLQLAYEQKLAFGLISNQGSPILMTDNLPLPPKQLMSAGYRKITAADDTWHVFGYFSEPQQIWIVTAQRDDVRQELVGQIVRNAYLTPWLIIPLILLVMLWLSDSLLRPIRAMAEALANRKADQLEPLSIPLPKEIEPIGKALNEYIARSADALARERQFSADAAHELKTPLAVVRLHQNALQQMLADNPDAVAHLRATEMGIERMTHMVEQLLLLSRLDSMEQLESTPIKVSDLVREALNSLLPVIADYQWHLEIDERLAVQGQAVYLEIVLKNLIENACKYSAPESHISIATNQLEKHIRITIADQGKGMSDSELARAAERFYRADKRTIEGAGLGLSICHKILQLHNGSMEMRPREGGGLAVSILLPAAEVSLL